MPGAMPTHLGTNPRNHVKHYLRRYLRRYYSCSSLENFYYYTKVYILFKSEILTKQVINKDAWKINHHVTLKRKLFEYLAVMSKNGNGDLPGHFTSQRVDGDRPCVPKRDPWLFLRSFFLKNRNKFRRLF